jgi:hypothetical protein
VSSSVSGHPAVSCLCESTYISALGLVAFHFPLHSLVPISCSLISCASCVLLHFSLCYLSWDKFASYPPLVTPAANILTKDGAIVSLTLASPLLSDGMEKRFCKSYNCRFDDDVSTLQDVPPPLYLLRYFEQPAPVAVGTWTPKPYQSSETATAASAPTPVKQNLGTNPTQGTGSVLEPSPALPSGTESSSANAGVALAFHGSGLGIALTGLLVTVLAF